jgi:gas vesicle protein
MGQSAEELTSQIEDTRERMAGNLDTLQDRVSPSAIVERRKQAARDRVTSVKDKVMGSAHSAKDSVSSAASSAASSASSGVSGTGSSVASSAQGQFQGAPLAAGLVAFGAGVVLAALLPASRLEAEAAHRVVETAKEHQGALDDARSAGQEIVANLKETATEAAQQVKDSAQESAQTVKDEGQSSAQSVKDDASS